MSSIKTMLPDQCLVLRDGNQQQLISTELVPGDILYIKLGDKLPADVRFVEASPDAKFDRSILTGLWSRESSLAVIQLISFTGETVPMRGVTESQEMNYLETPCIGMAGTHCVSGSALGLVVATGDNSVFGRLAKLTSTPKSGLTLLEKEIYYFVA
jgi:sodium/potassium-transporting ATPase subunit alpha